MKTFVDSGWKRERWQEFGYSVPAALGTESAPAPMPGATYTKRQPARPASVESDVLVPFWQAVISAVLGGVLVLVITVFLSIENEWSLWVPPLSFLGATALILFCAWLWRLGAHCKLLWLVEMITGKDLDQDGQKGPPRQAEPFCVEWTDRENKRKEKHYWPVPEAQIREIGQAHLRGVNLSKRELAKHTSLSEEKALEVLAYMRQKAYAQYVDGNRTELTGRGEWFFKQLLSS